MDPAGKLIAVTGAAGQQGGAVARRLLREGWVVRALTRDPSKPEALALAQAGAQVAAADHDDPASLAAAFQGAYGVFSVQNFWLPGVGAEGEVRQGQAIGQAAQAAGAAHLVYTSVGAAQRGLGQAHFTSKLEIEAHLRALGLPFTILRPAFFMENFLFSRSLILGGAYAGFGLRPDKGLQMIAVDDVAAFAALAFAQPAGYQGRTLELAGDELTEPQITETFSKVIGRPMALTARQMPEGAEPTPEQLAMFEFYNGQGYEADIAALRQYYPPLQTLEQWLRATGWEDAGRA